MRASISCTGNAAISLGVRALAKSRFDNGTVSSSRVRMEIMQAINCSNAEEKPSSYNSNNAALRLSFIASRIASIARSMSKDGFSPFDSVPMDCFSANRSSSGSFLAIGMPPNVAPLPQPTARIRWCASADRSGCAGPYARTFLRLIPHAHSACV